jgi:hypothetical protein
VLATQTANLIGFWRLNETSGATAVDSSPEANNGAYTGVDLANAAGPDGVLVPFFDGTNDYVNLYSAAFNTDFALAGAEGTLAIWIKVNAAAVWSDATFRNVVYIANGGTITNGVEILKSSAANTVVVAREGADVREQVSITLSATGWTHLALTWSEAADQMIAYLNGSQTGATQTTLGAYTGNLGSTTTNIGAKVTTPTNPWHGWLALPAVWKTPLTPAQILSLATV